MGVVADEAPEPSKREFTRVVTDEQLGIPLDEALEVTAQRMQSTDMDQVAVLALVQREAGGNTAEVLDQVTANIRARMDVRRLVKVLTAQGKFSSWMIAAVPVGIFIFLIFVNPSHLDPLFHETLGQVASIMAIVMVMLGFYMSSGESSRSSSDHDDPLRPHHRPLPPRRRGDDARARA